MFAIISISRSAFAMKLTGLLEVIHFDKVIDRGYD